MGISAPQTLRQFLRSVRREDGYVPAVLLGIEAADAEQIAAPPDDDEPLEPQSEEMTLTAKVTAGHWAQRLGEDHADRPCIRLDNPAKRGARVALTIGRSRACDVFVPDTSVSKHHATLTANRTQGEWTIVDMDSRNGTYVDGTRIVAGKAVAVWPGARLGFGAALFLFVDPGTLRQLASLVGD